MPHLVVDISSHGFGHAAMTLPVLDALHALRPDIRITIRSSLGHDWVGARLSAPFTHVHDGAEFGLVMVDSFRARVAESLAAYERLHADWPRAVEAAAERLAPLRADLLLSNIAYLSIGAAARLGVPAWAYSSLNWADVFQTYCGAEPGAEAIRGQIADCYAAAEVFITPEPSMPMPSIPATRRLGPVARLGSARGGEIRGRLGLDRNVRLLLVSMGGIPTPIDFDAWPALEGVHVLDGSDGGSRNPAVTSWCELGMSFADVLASSDALLAKPGYGLFVEAACGGVPVLFVPRPGWPESEALEAWLTAHAAAAEIAERRALVGEISGALAALLARPAVPLPQPSGVNRFAADLSQRLPPTL